LINALEAGSVDNGAQVPVLAIVTKFDTFVQDVLQELEEAAEEEGEEVDSLELERKATQLASERFDEHYSKPLMALPYPPRAVLALSDSGYIQEQVHITHHLIFPSPQVNTYRYTFGRIDSGNDEGTRTNTDSSSPSSIRNCSDRRCQDKIDLVDLVFIFRTLKEY
jgi:hypothetical protein